MRWVTFAFSTGFCLPFVNAGLRHRMKLQGHLAASAVAVTASSDVGFQRCESGLLSAGRGPWVASHRTTAFLEPYPATAVPAIVSTCALR